MRLIGSPWGTWLIECVLLTLTWPSCHCADTATAIADAAKRKRRRAGDADEAAGGDEAFLDAQGFGDAPPLGNGLPDGGAAVAEFDSSDEEEVSTSLQGLGF